MADLFLNNTQLLQTELHIGNERSSATAFGEIALADCCRLSGRDDRRRGGRRRPLGRRALCVVREVSAGTAKGPEPLSGESGGDPRSHVENQSCMNASLPSAAGATLLCTSLRWRRCVLQQPAGIGACVTSRYVSLSERL